MIFILLSCSLYLPVPSRTRQVSSSPETPRISLLVLYHTKLQFSSLDLVNLYPNFQILWVLKRRDTLELVWRIKENWISRSGHFTFNIKSFYHTHYLLHTLHFLGHVSFMSCLPLVTTIISVLYLSVHYSLIIFNKSIRTT